jgi:hypothetical protein
MFAGFSLPMLSDSDRFPPTNVSAGGDAEPEE